METRIKMYEQAIKDLENVKIKAIENEVKRMKLIAVGLAACALIMGAALMF